MTIKLEKMGMNFKKGEKNGSDVLNHRVRAEFTDMNGVHVTADFGGYEKKKAIEKNGKITYTTINANSLHVDGAYRNENGCWAYRPENLGINVANYSFTKMDILKFLSDVTGNKYTDIEFI